MKSPFFSVIIPTFNRAENLQRALNSISRQTFRNYEVLVCDDGSTDNTPEIVRGYADSFPLQYLWEENWGGPARPRNNGIKSAWGEWICFLDSDDWWYPDKLAVVSKHISDSNSDIYYHDLDIYTPRGRKIFRKVRGKALDKPFFDNLMKEGNVIANSSAVVRKSILCEVGGLVEDQTLVTVEDFDLWVRLAKIADALTYIPETLGAYWLDGKNTTEISNKQISRIQKVYGNFLPQLNVHDRREVRMRVDYSVARILYRMGFLNEAADLLKNSVRTEHPEIKAKSFFFLLLIPWTKLFLRMSRQDS